MNVKKAAKAILERINTAEKAVALKGAEREQYLKALDEVYGSAEQRAKDLGFGPDTWYHGTGKDFDKFDQKEVNRLLGYSPEHEARGGWKAFVTNDKIAAKRFARRFYHDAPVVKELKLRGNTKDPYITLKQNQLLENWDPANTWRAVEQPEAKKALEKAGIDNAYITESQYANKQKGNSKNVAVGNENNLRDVKAAFDPRFKDSPLLMAGAAGAMAAGALAGSNEAEASPMNNKAVKEILEQALKRAAEKPNKFEEARGILRRTPEGRAEIVMPEFQGQTKTLSAETPDQVVNMYGELHGASMPEKLSDTKPSTETIRERIKRNKAQENLENPEDKTPKIGDEQSFAGKALDALSIPQKILMRKTASALGVDLPKESGSASEDADAASEALTETAAENLGIKHPAAKAAIKTVLDLGYDPLNLVGGKLAGKVASKAVEGGSKLLKPEVRESVDKLVRRMRSEEAMKVLGRKTPASETTAGRMAAQGKEVIKPRNIIKSSPW